MENDYPLADVPPQCPQEFDDIAEQYRCAAFKEVSTVMQGAQAIVIREYTSNPVVRK